MSNELAGTIPYLESHALSRDYADIKVIQDEIVEAMRSREEKELRRIFSDALGYEFTESDANRFRIVSQVGLNNYHIMLDGIQICKVTTKMDEVSATGGVKITTYYEQS